MNHRLAKNNSERRPASERIDLSLGALFHGNPSAADNPVRRTAMQPTTPLALAVVVVWIGLGAGCRAEAGGIALSTPTGLSSGESFRFVFVTDGSVSQNSSNMADYNSFVNAQAGGATYDGSIVTWNAIGSTASVNAIDNIGQSAAPVFLADGTLVTSSSTSAGLWSGSLLNPIDRDLSGELLRGFAIYTGTTTAGVATGNPLGDFLGSSGGSSAETNRIWIDSGGVLPSFADLRMYGISQVLTVGSAVPEPSSMLLAGTAIIVGCACRLSHRRRKKPAAPASQLTQHDRSGER
jgi:hypothetical protein